MRHRTALLAAVVAAWVVGVAAGDPPRITGASVDESTVAAVLHVHAGSPAADDAGNGSPDAPLRTITAAVRLAEANNRRAVATKILIHPGVYREAVALNGAADRTDAAIVFEAVEPGKAVVSGSDIWRDWQPAEAAGVYTRAWPYTWGVADNPWAGNGIDIRPVVRRREMVFVDGELMRQVVAPEELAEGRFYVSEAEGRIFLQPPAGADLSRAVVEVAVRSGIFHVNGQNGRVRNLVVRGLVFEHDTSTYGWAGAPMFEHCDNVLLEDCLVRWNTADGAKFARCRDVTLRRVRSEHNAHGGMNFHTTQNLLMEQVDCSHNNWRGDWGDFRHWHPSGAKFYLARGVWLKGFTAVNNQARGLWFDTDCADVVVDSAVLADNNDYGMHIEANQGPVWLRDSVIANNTRVGLFGQASSYVYVTGNTFYGNREGQFIAEGSQREGPNMITSLPQRFRAQNWTMRDNVFVSTAEGQPLLTLRRPDLCLESLEMDRNLYHGPPGAKLIHLDSRRLSLEEWQVAGGVDLGSIQAAPGFVDAERGDFSLRQDSPVRQRSSWPRRDPSETGRAAVAARLAAARENWETPYPLAAEIRQWVQLDLSPLANHAMDGAPRAWMGGGLRFPAAGQVGIQGVPFQVIRRQDNDGNDIVAMASTRMDQLVGRPLAGEVAVPVGTSARVVYFLHGMVHAMGGEAAQYRVIYADGTEEVIRLVAPDMLNRLSAEEAARLRAQANVQADSANSRHVVLLDRDNPSNDAGARHVYTLQWVNPHPEKDIREIRPRTDPAKEICLLILAITVGR